MGRLRRLTQHARYLGWYLSSTSEIPLCSDLDECLPLPDLSGIQIVWPDRYSWLPGSSCLDVMRNALQVFVPVVSQGVLEVDRKWHERGGFPVPPDAVQAIGTPRNPKDANDIRGEIFEVRRGSRRIRCAYDYSDFPMVSSEIAAKADLYFKCVTPKNQIPANVACAGYFPSRPGLLARARSVIFKRAVTKNIDVYARFGTWTDSQNIREQLVRRMANSSVGFRGGLGTVVFPAYLTELMQARIALDAPGQGPITYRLPEAMALGAVIVCAPPACVFPESLDDGVHYAATKADGGDVVQVCERLLKDRDRMAKIASNGMKYFDRNFSPQSRARRILRQAIQLIN